MNYKNAKDVLPRNLILEIQKYTAGEMLYIPKSESMRSGWGENSGIRSELLNRNKAIKENYCNGTSIGELMRRHCLSESSIKKIIYTQ